MTRRQTMLMRKTVRKTCEHTAIIFRKETTRLPGSSDWVEEFVEVQRGAAHFYTIDTSDSEKGGREYGKEAFTPTLKVRLMDFNVKADDRIVPIINGNVGGLTGSDLYEVQNKPLDPSFRGVFLETAIEVIDSSFRIERIEGVNVLLLGKE